MKRTLRKLALHQLLEFNFHAGCSIYRLVSAKRMKEKSFDQVDFLSSLIEQCPNNCVAELQCNWTSTTYSDKEIAEINKYLTKKIEDCQTDRQTEVFKSFLLESYKFQEQQFGKFTIWDGGLNLLITDKNKNKIVEKLKEYFDNRDVCHCQIYTQEEHIVECYDTFTHNKLDSNIFSFTAEEKQKFGDNDIDIYFDKFA